MGRPVHVKINIPELGPKAPTAKATLQKFEIRVFALSEFVGVFCICLHLGLFRHVILPLEASMAFHQNALVDLP